MSIYRCSIPNYEAGKIFRAIKNRIKLENQYFTEFISQFIHWLFGG